MCTLIKWCLSETYQCFHKKYLWNADLICLDEFTIFFFLQELEFRYFLSSYLQWKAFCSSKVMNHMRFQYYWYTIFKLSPASLWSARSVHRCNIVFVGEIMNSQSHIYICNIRELPSMAKKHAKSLLLFPLTTSYLFLRTLRIFFPILLLKENFGDISFSTSHLHIFTASICLIWTILVIYSYFYINVALGFKF